MSYELFANKGPLEQVASNSGWSDARRFLARSISKVIQHFISLQTSNVGVWLGLLVIIGYAVSASAQTANPIADAREREELWVTNYRNLAVVISLEDGVSEVGLTEDMVRTKVELRLRQANIRPSARPVGINDPQTLLVSVSVVGQGFHIEIEFMRPVHWFLPDGTRADHMETVWIRGRTGTHASKPDFILSTIDKGLDQFLNAYLKANQ